MDSYSVTELYHCFNIQQKKKKTTNNSTERIWYRNNYQDEFSIILKIFTKECGSEVTIQWTCELNLMLLSHTTVIGYSTIG